MRQRLSGVQSGIIVATLVTALIHLGLALLLLRHPADRTMGVLFILNGLGYLGLLAAYFLPQPFFQERHNFVRFALMGFAAVTIVAWAIMNGNLSDPVGITAKLAELVLIVLLFLDRPKRQE